MDFIVTRYVYYYVGRSEGILRLPAVVWGVSSVAVVYWLGKNMFDKTTGLLAAALLAIMPAHIYYSRELRPYSLAALMVLLSTLAFHRALSRTTRGAWVLYGATLAVGMYAHYYVAVVGILHGLYFVLMALARRLPWRGFRSYFVAAGVAGLLFLPWVLSDSYRSSNTFQLPAASALLSAPFVSRGVTSRLTIDRPLTWFVGFAWAAAALGTALGIRGRSAERGNQGLLALVSIGGMASVLALDYTAPYFFAARQFVPYTPILILLVAAASLALFREARRYLFRPTASASLDALAVGLLLLFAAGTLSGSLSDVYRHRKQDWRGVSRYLMLHTKSEDAVLLRVTFDVEFYAPELSGQIDELRSMKTVRAAAKTHPRVWIVDWSSALDRYVPDVGEWVESEKPLQIRGFPGMEVYVYSEVLSTQELEDSLKR